MTRYEDEGPDGEERTARLVALLGTALERLLRREPDERFAIPPNLSLHGDGPDTGREEERGVGA